jgi:hypothetical protein
MPVIELRIANSTSKVVPFYLEPWGGKYKVPSQGALRIVIESPSPGYPELEWELSDDIHALVVRGPTGVVATVYDGEDEVFAE